MLLFEILVGQRLFCTECEMGRSDEEDEAGKSQNKDLNGASNSHKRGVVGRMSKNTAFLYSGPDAVQKGVSEGAIDPKRVALIHGLVKGPAGESLDGVQVSVHAKEELGSVVSAEDGSFVIALNGGAPRTILLRKDGYFSVRRRVTAKWNDHAHLSPIIMTSKHSSQNVSETSKPGVFRGGEVEDKHGKRKSTILTPAQGKISRKDTEGKEATFHSPKLVATEYTVGADGHARMPAPLPPSSAYTYAVELGAVDEDDIVGSVSFENPAIYYVENFLNFPVGGSVPSGYYDKEKATWVPADDGRVIRILKENDGLAELDVTGKGKPSSLDELKKIGITDDERKRIADLYEPNQTLWRIPIPHFSIWDFNWPPGDQPQAPDVDDPSKPDEKDPDPCKEKGSIIQIQNQVLIDDVEITGAPFSLTYSSARALGDRRAYALYIPVSGAKLPEGLLYIRLEISIAGKSSTFELAAEANQMHTFIWDGLDSFGRVVNGSRPVTVRVGYAYTSIYSSPVANGKSFAMVSGVPMEANEARKETIVWKEWSGLLGDWNALETSLGGWSVSVHHVYDPTSRTIYYGDGTEESVFELGYAISTVPGSEDVVPGEEENYSIQQSSPKGIAVAADGSIFVAEDMRHCVRKISKDGIHSIFAGSPAKDGFGGDGGPAKRAAMREPTSVALGADGSVYIADPSSHRVRRVDKKGIITTVAGNGRQGFTGDGGPATAAALNEPYGVAVDADGAVYIADSSNNRIRRVGTDGIIWTFAGNGKTGDGELIGDRGPATKANLCSPGRLAVAGDGSVYVADSYNHRIRKITPDGIIDTVAGCGSVGYKGEGGLATKCELNCPTGIDIAADGSFYIADCDNHRVLHVRIDGTIHRISGSKTGKHAGGEGDGGPAIKGTFNQCKDVAVSPTGEIFAVDYMPNKIRRIGSADLDAPSNQIRIASSSGRSVYIFDEDGRHLSTVDSTSGLPVFSFEYDRDGQLVCVTDSKNNKTSILYDEFGCSKVVSSTGHETTLSLSKAGFLENVETPGGRSFKFEYGESGLLLSSTSPEGNRKEYNYDRLGRLVEHKNAAGGVMKLESVKTDKGIIVTRTSPNGGKCQFAWEKLTQFKTKRSCTCCDGTSSSAIFDKEQDYTMVSEDGTITELNVQPDPRFGMQTLLPEKWSIKTPSGLCSTGSYKCKIKPAKLADFMDFLSITKSLSIDGKVYEVSLDREKLSRRVVTPGGKFLQIEYDKAWRPSLVRASGIADLRASYDRNGRISTVHYGESEESKKVEYKYDKHNRVESFCSPLQMVSFRYNDDDQVIAATNYGELSVSFERNAEGLVTSLQPPSKPAHRFKYNSMNLLSEYSSPDQACWKWTYDLEGNLVNEQSPDAASVSVSWSEGKLSAVQSENIDLKYKYNKCGQVQKIQSNDEVLSYEYDGFLLTKIIWDGTVNASLQRKYVSGFLIDELLINGTSIVKFERDDDRSLTRAGILQIQRNKESGFIQNTLCGRIKESFQYNCYGSVSSFEARFGDQLLYRADYVRDAKERLLKTTEQVATEKRETVFSYDKGRLSQVTGKDQTHYGYDENGNRVEVRKGSTTIKGSFDDCDRLVNFGSCKFHYSRGGFLLRIEGEKEESKFQYDDLGNLIGAEIGASRIEYKVDALNRRIARKVSSQNEKRSNLQKLIYGSLLTPVAELNEADMVVTVFIYATRSNVPDYLVRDERKYKVISDRLGSVRLVVDSESGELVQQIDYDAFGNIVNDTNPGFQPFGFAGGLYDPITKLTHFGRREYDARTGRWITPDPLLFAGGDTNLYSYCGNDPMNYIDPSGLSFSPAGSVINNSPESVWVIVDGRLVVVCPGESIPFWHDPDGVWVGDEYYPVGRDQAGIVINPDGSVERGAYQIPIPIPGVPIPGGGRIEVPIPVGMIPLPDTPKRPAIPWDKQNNGKSRRSPAGSGARNKRAGSGKSPRERGIPGCGDRRIPADDE